MQLSFTSTTLFTPLTGAGGVRGGTEGTQLFLGNLFTKPLGRGTYSARQNDLINMLAFIVPDPKILSKTIVNMYARLMDVVGAKLHTSAIFSVWAQLVFNCCVLPEGNRLVNFVNKCADIGPEESSTAER